MPDSFAAPKVISRAKYDITYAYIQEHSKDQNDGN